MKNKKFILFLIGVAALTLVVAFVFVQTLKRPQFKTIMAANKLNSPQIATEGTIHSQDEVALHFQSGGKVIYLPFKEGDAVKQGQTIARLDTYALQRQLTSALNTYKSTRDTFDQTQQNSTNGVLAGSQKFTIDTQNKNGVGADEDKIVSDAVKRIVDQSQANLDNSQINIELANYAIQLATLTSPINGIITHEDVTVPNVNVTTATSFSIADPTEMVLRVNVNSSDIDFITVGSAAVIHLDGSSTSYPAQVIKIYPQRVALPNGQMVYQVEVANDTLKESGKLDQAGTALITSSLNKDITLVPVWLILSHNYVWVLENNKPVLKKVEVGKVHGEMIEVTGGLVPDDQIITNPDAVAAQKYSLL